MKNIFKATALSNRIFKSALAFGFLLLVAFVTSSTDFAIQQSAVHTTSYGEVTAGVVSNEIGGQQSAPRSYAVLDNGDFPGDIGGPQSAPRPYAHNKDAIQDIGGTGNPPRNLTYACDGLAKADANFDIGTQACPRQSVLSDLKNGGIGGQGNQAPRTLQGLLSLDTPIGGQRVTGETPPKLYMTSVLLEIEPIGGNSCPRNLKDNIALNFAS